MFLLGLLMEYLVLLATLIYPAFRPPFLLTRCEVLKCGVTHYFDQGPARRDLGYEPKEPDMDEVRGGEGGLCYLCSLSARVVVGEMACVLFCCGLLACMYRTILIDRTR